MATSCKLYTVTPQSIQPQTWTAIRFDVVLSNDGNMYQGDGTVINPDSALIMPPQDADFVWFRCVKWASITLPLGDTRERQFMERFCRDPYTAPDDTGSADEADTPGQEFHLGGWFFRGHAGQSVALQVWHDHTSPVDVTHAQFVAATWDY